MYITKYPLRDKKKTVNKINYIVNKYFRDICLFNKMGIPLDKLTLKNYYSFIKNIPYRRDQKPVEILLRPKYLLVGKDIGLDCKKKSILMASFCKAKKIQYRFVCVSQRPDKRLHHIFTQVNIGKGWKNADATYSDNKLFQDKQYTKMEIIK
jgi:hypothetical protein